MTVKSMSIQVEEYGDKFLYTAIGHHNKIEFAKAVREAEGLPDFVINESSDILQGHIDRNGNIQREASLGTRPVTYWWD